MKTMNLLIAGFGGQGVLFAGKFLAYGALMQDRQVSWLPSYGPEMRGGTANCSVIISDDPVGSPIISEPDHLIVMNLPSFEKYQNAVTPGGVILLDATLIAARPTRTDVMTFALPATQMAADAGLDGLANMVLMGKFLKECYPEGFAIMEKMLEKVVPPKKAHLIEANLRALKLGAEYEA